MPNFGPPAAMWNSPASSERMSEGVDDPEAALDDQEAALPPLKEQEQLAVAELDPVSHETKPPARFTEATLVECWKRRIGRPSTYASIISTIQDRNYAVKTGTSLFRRSRPWR